MEAIKKDNSHLLTFYHKQELSFITKVVFLEIKALPVNLIYLRGVQKNIK